MGYVLCAGNPNYPGPSKLNPLQCRQAREAPVLSSPTLNRRERRNDRESREEGVEILRGN